MCFLCYREGGEDGRSKLCKKIALESYEYIIIIIIIIIPVILLISTNTHTNTNTGKSRTLEGVGKGFSPRSSRDYDIVEIKIAVGTMLLRDDGNDAAAIIVAVVPRREGASLTS